MTFKHQISPPLEPIGEVQTTLAQIVLADINFPDGSKPLGEKILRLNKVEVMPGGTVPFHSHHNRPAIMVITQGEIIEYNSKSEKPIRHSVGSLSVEYNDVEHWWKNETNEIVVIYSAMLVDA